MSPWLVLPVKSLAEGKSRLAGHLSPAARRALNARLLAGSLDLAARHPGLERTVVVSACAEVLATARARGAMALPEVACGLNPAVEQAVAWLRERTQDAIVVLSCDLPCARPDDLRALVHPDEIVLATDRAGQGTNALGLPAGASLRFRYGPGSRGLHAQEAARLGLRLRVLEGSSLAFDVDTPEDLRWWESHRRSREGPAPAVVGGGGDPATAMEAGLDPRLRGDDEASDVRRAPSPARALPPSHAWQPAP